MGARAAIVAVIVALSVSLSVSKASAFDNDGNVFRVNTYTANNQMNAAIAGLDGGGFVVLWESDRQDQTDLGVFGQTYDADGVDSDEFEVTAYTTRDQREVSAAGLSDGDFVVTWTSDARDGSGLGIFGQIFETDGEPVLTADFRVNTYTSGAQSYSRVASLPTGFVVVWTSAGQDGSGDAILSQRFNADGGKAGTEFRANTYTTGAQRTPSVQALEDGGFVVAWTSDAQDGSGSGVFAQRFNQAGAPAGTEFRLNSITTNNQVRPVLAAAGPGAFVAAWEGRSLELNAASTDGVAARSFDAQGSAAAAEFVVNSYTTGNQEDATIAGLPRREVLVAWESIGGNLGRTGTTVNADTDKDGIFARLLSAAGAVVGTEFQVNTYTTEEQDDPQAAAIDDGRYVVVWESTGQDGSGTGIYAQVYTSDLCGDATGDGVLSVADALQVLKGAVSAGPCTKCVCDANGNDGIETADALIVLKAALGDLTGLACKAC